MKNLTQVMMGVSFHDYWKLVIDYKLQLKSTEHLMLGYNKREPGSVLALMRAYHLMLEIVSHDRRLTVEDIQQLHQTAMCWQKSDRKSVV